LGFSHKRQGAKGFGSLRALAFVVEGGREIPISLGEIHKSAKEIHISLEEIGKSAGNLYISPKEIGISLSNLCISSRETSWLKPSFR